MRADDKIPQKIPNMTDRIPLPLQLTTAQIKFLARKTPPEFIKQRAGPGGIKLDYVEVGYVIDVLNQAFGWDWDFRITAEQIGKVQVWVRGELAVRLGDHMVVKSQYGGANIKFNRQNNTPIGIADDLKAAASDCLKKCASMLGVAGDIYWRDLDQFPAG
jgi:hypothetical protein